MVDNKKMRRWVVLATGGTMAGTSTDPGDHTNYVAAQLGVGVLLDAVPGLQEVMPKDRLICEQVAQLDSKDMDHLTWQLLVSRCDHWLAQPEVGGVVITHGTDTLEETAWFLQEVLDSAKPVVLTCAMRPATALMPDGPQNLLDAMRVVQDPQAGQGVLVVCAGRIHGAREVCKVHPYRLDPFSSGETGPRGWVEQGQVRWAPAAHLVAARPSLVSAVLSQPVTDWPWVEVLHSHAGADARRVTALVEAGVNGLVVAGTGNGTVHQQMLLSLAQAQSRGVAVRLSTRCVEGQIVGTGAGLQMSEAGLQAHKARISLMLDLMGRQRISRQAPRTPGR